MSQVTNLPFHLCLLASRVFHWEIYNKITRPIKSQDAALFSGRLPREQLLCVETDVDQDASAEGVGNWRSCAGAEC